MSQTPPPEWLPNDRALDPQTPVWDVTATGDARERARHAHTRGLQWYLYSIKAPLAWKFTRGDALVGIEFPGNYDNAVAADGDISNKTSAADAGNWIANNAASLGDGLDSTLAARYGHEYGVASVAVGLADNDGQGVQNAGMLGICPECVGGRSVAARDTPVGIIPEKLVDIDMTADGVLTGYSVVNKSFGGAYLTPAFDTTGLASDYYADCRRQFLRDVDSAKVVVASSGNDFRQPKVYLDTIVNGEQRRYYMPTVFIPGCYVFNDSLENEAAAFDMRYISVGAIEDGGQWCSDSTYCSGGAFGCDYNSGLMARGVEQFRPTYHFSLGTDKFDEDADVAQRLERKMNAMIDLVAPGGDMLQATGSEHRYGFVDGTSLSAPLVSGTIGLMLSLDRWLGTGAGRDGNGNIIEGRAVHRRAYNLLTFTADKINDNAAAYWYEQPSQIDTIGGVPVVFHVYLWNTDRDGSLIQYYYAEQANDPLRRTWAQRMGFGKVNAYRAVAHSIGLKADQSYDASATLAFGDDERGPLGQRIMHMGAWYREGANEDVNGNGVNGELLDLYEAGGASLPGESHNNQGVTEINGSGVTLTVPGDATLAIDGIVTTDTPNGGNGITTTGDGEIVAEGMLDNIELSGDTFIGDLIVRGDEGTNGCLMAGPAQGNVCEVFGNVQMQDSGAVFVRGWMRVRPGGQITMSGGRDVYVKPGGTLEMMYGSRIERDPETHFDRMVVIDSGATLLIPDGAHIDLYTHVYVLPHGRVRIGDSAAVSLDHFRVEPDGVFEIGPGAHLALRDPDYYSECQGHMTIAGEADSRVRITGRFPEIELAVERVDCEGVTGYAHLIAKGDINAIASSNLFMAYADFSNVALQAINIRIGDPLQTGQQTVESCNFTASRSLGMPWQNLVEVNYWAGDGDPLFAPVELSPIFTNCLFADEDGIDAGAARIDQDYRLMGLFSMRLNNLIVQDCEFRHLSDALRTHDVGGTQVYNSSADVVDNFVQVQGPGSVSLECGNTAQSVWRCGTYSATARSRIYDAAYANIHSGIIAASADRVWMRGSHLDFFMEGVRSVGGTVFLRPNENPGQVDEFGRNVFVVNPRTQPQSEFFDGDRVRLDNHLRDQGIVVSSCGLNNFASETELHIDANYLATVLVTSNRWNNPDGTFHVRRGPLVQVLGDQLDQSESAIGCGDDDDFLSCPPPPELDQLGGMNPFGPVMDDTPDSVYFRGLDDLANPALLPTVRRARSKDTFRAALKGDSTEKRLDTLRGWIGTILATDTTTTNDTLLRGGLMFLDGVILEHLRRYEDARTAFELVCQSVPTSPDSMLAGWRLKHLDLLECGQTHGTSYDEKMTAWNNQIRQDLKRYRTPLLSQAKRSGETGPDLGPTDCRLSSIAPNPFGDKTMIRIDVGAPQNVRIEIADMQGRIVAVVADERFEAGTFELEFRNEGCAPGVYLCRMQSANGYNQTELMFIE